MFTFQWDPVSSPLTIKHIVNHVADLIVGMALPIASPIRIAIFTLDR